MVSGRNPLVVNLGSSCFVRMYAGFEANKGAWMGKATLLMVVAAGFSVAGISLASQTPADLSQPVPAPAAPATSPATGGRLHGVIKSGNIPLPGVAVTAQNTLTGKKYATTTDITGAWQLVLPQNGR